MSSFRIIFYQKCIRIIEKHKATAHTYQGCQFQEYILMPLFARCIHFLKKLFPKNNWVLVSRNHFEQSTFYYVDVQNRSSSRITGPYQRTGWWSTSHINGCNKNCGWNNNTTDSHSAFDSRYIRWSQFRQLGYNSESNWPLFVGSNWNCISSSVVNWGCSLVCLEIKLFFFWRSEHFFVTIG